MNDKWMINVIFWLIVLYLPYRAIYQTYGKFSQESIIYYELYDSRKLGKP